MKRILVIEDDVEERQLFKTVLEEAGYDVLEAANGAIGLHMYTQQPCNLVITDIYMPEKEGLETIIELKKISPGLPIIAISGGIMRTYHFTNTGADSTLKAAEAFGAARILHKPIKLQELLHAVNELVQAL